MSARRSLQQQIISGLLVYVVLLTLAVLAYGVVAHERAERLAWSSLLGAEMDRLLASRQADPSFRWSDTETLELHIFDLPDSGAHALARLPPGLHDEVYAGERELAVLVRDVGGQRFVLALDISDLERQERTLALALTASAAVLVTLLTLVVLWTIRQLVGPLYALKHHISALTPESPNQVLPQPSGASVEMAVIVDAFNGYLARNQAFVEREREFIDSVSHELRTPVAVIGGAAELALARPQLDPVAGGQLQRILHTVRGVDSLITLLLTLAKTPERLAALSDRVALTQLLPEIIDDHRHLCEGKDLQIVLLPIEGVEELIEAPLIMVQAAIGNLLRNAIENSDRGSIRITLGAGPTVVIEDPGHGMSPEEISRLYRQLSRGASRDRGGIGLALIARLCSHLGWQLAIEPAGEQGTRVQLNFATASPTA